jgi:hypothetical protein
MYVIGQNQGWTKTGIKVIKGDTISMHSSGIILFAKNVPGSNGYPRNPDGLDEHNKYEIAPSGWPAQGYRRNSLVFRIGSWLAQGGTNVSFAAGATGELEVSNNDNDCGDNAGYWTVNLQVYEAPNRGINQSMLVVLHGAKSIGNKSAIEAQLRMFLATLNRNAGSNLKIKYQFAVLPPSFRINSLDVNNYPNFNDAAMRTHLEKALAGIGCNVNAYHSVFFLFDNGIDGANTINAAGLSWAWYKSTAIPIQNTIASLNELILHEYLHHLDYYFDKQGEQDFINPDCWTGVSGTAFCRRNYSTHPNFSKPPKPTELAFYEGTLKYIDKGKNTSGSDLLYLVNYRRLDGVFGYWE